MNILEFAKIIGAKVEFRGEIDPSGERWSWCNVDLKKGTEHARTVDEPLASFGRDEGDGYSPPNPNKAGENLVAGFRGRRISFTGGLPREPFYDVPEDLEWGIKIGE